MATFDKCIIGQICSEEFPPVCVPVFNAQCLTAAAGSIGIAETDHPFCMPICGSLFVPGTAEYQDCVRDCLEGGCDDYIYTPTEPSDLGPGGTIGDDDDGDEEDIPPCDYELCLLAKCCDVDAECAATMTGADSDGAVTQQNNCPDDPSGCVTGCCCCDSSVMAETLGTRCYDMVGLSCNFDGSGPAPGATFPANCDDCFSACDLLIGGDCSSISKLPWWDLGNVGCECFCKEPYETSYTEEWISPSETGILGSINDFYYSGGVLYAAGNFLNIQVLEGDPPVLATTTEGITQYAATGWQPVNAGVEFGSYTDFLAVSGDEIFTATADSKPIKAANGTLVPPGNTDYDLNSDGIIDLIDLGIAKIIKYVAQRWTGAAWQEIGRIAGPDIDVGAGQWAAFTDVEIFDSDVYYGCQNVTRIKNPDGSYTNITTNLAMWDGAWHDTGATWAITGNVTALYVFGATLIVATDQAVYQASPGVAVTNLTAAGITGKVYAMTTFNGNLIVAGQFSDINGVACSNMAEWTGTVWQSLGGDGTNGMINDMAVYNSMLYVGGTFTQAGGETAQKIGRFDGTSWCKMTGVSHIIAGSASVNALYQHDDYLRVGGRFDKAGGDIIVLNDANFHTELSSCDLFQAECALYCALCGKCDASVAVDNSTCKYQFTLTPSAECCKDAAYENVWIGFANHGSLRGHQSEFNYVNSRCTSLLETIENSSSFQLLGSPYFTSGCSVAEGTAAHNPTIECTPTDGITPTSECPMICCPENQTNEQFIVSLADTLCSLAQTRGPVSGTDRYEFVVYVHGFAEQCDTDSCPDVIPTGEPCTPANLEECNTQWAAARKIEKALELLNGRLHVLNFTLDCQEGLIAGCRTMECATESGGAHTEIVSTGAIDADCVLDFDDAVGTCKTNHPSGFVVEYCTEARVWPAGTQWNANNTSVVDNLFAEITNMQSRPPTSCDCIDNTSYIVTLDSRDCSEQSIDVCGTTVVVSAPDGKSVCCEEIGCDCSTECPPYWDDPACDKGPQCPCGVECIPICPGGGMAFESLEQAVLANWAHCCMHAADVTPDECMETDCVWINFAQPWEDPNFRYICKSEIEAEVEREWDFCQTGVEPEDEDGTGAGISPVVRSAVGDIETGQGPVDIPGCGFWPPTNVDCNTDIILGREAGCTSVRHPDVVVLNNGIGLVAYEDTTDKSVIKIKQFHTSIKNKVHPNRKMRHGRLENPTKWIGSSSGSAKSFKLYYYEPIGDITTEETADAGTGDADSLFFLSGPFRYQVFTISSIGIDDAGEYIQLMMPSTNFENWSWAAIMREYGSQEDDRYDVQWITYDQVDRYDEGKPNGCYIGSAYGSENDQYQIPIPEGIDPELDATIDDNNAALELPPHYYNGERISVAYPSITHLDNYDNENENAHFVYVTYQALEDDRWKIYLRQLRLSEFREAATVLLAESHLIPLDDAGVLRLVWSCRASCISYDCDQDAKSSTITSVWVAKTEDGLEVYNSALPLGSNSVCGQLFRKNILTVVLIQQTVWDSSSSQCPDEGMLMNWKVGDDITTSVPSFTTTLDQNEINTWAQSHFATVFSNMPVSDDIVVNPISAALVYHSSQGGGWSIFTDETTTIASDYKGIYVSDPILVYDCEEGHCTRPVVKADYANKLFIAFEATENSLQQIKLVGTGEPENSLPIGSDSAFVSLTEGFDQSFNFFHMRDDFTYQANVTNQGINQHPCMWIDLNNVIHLAWHSNKDNQWEIYYANSDSNFALARITKYDSKSFNPDIAGTDDGDLFIVWHDNRFGPWEIMIAPYNAERVKPLFQQNEYLASFRNEYTHSINFVPIIITNETNSTICFTDILVTFYEDRLLSSPKFNVKRSDYPFAFTERFDLGTGANELITAESYCVASGETKEFILSLTPDIFINPGLTSTTELPIGLKQNKTYFTSVAIRSDAATWIEMPTQLQSTSCTDCTGISLKYDHTACLVTVPVVNRLTETIYVNVRVNFYTASSLENRVAQLQAYPGQDLEAFAVKGERADTVWGSSGFKLQAGERLDIACYPALSKAQGLICGYIYYTTTEVTYSTSAITPSSTWEELSDEASYWMCNCQSVRWSEDSAVPIVDLQRWMSSGSGFSDSRVTISHGNSLNPKIRAYRGQQGVIIYQDDRDKAGSYMVYGSVFDGWPNYKMRASGTMRSSDVFEGHSLIWETGGPFELLGGQRPSFDTDIYHNIFLAYETNQSEVNQKNYGDRKLFKENTQSTITVHKCGYTTSFSADDQDPCAVISKHQVPHFVLGYPAPESGLIFSEIIKQFRVKNEFVRYHITRNQIPTPVVNQAAIIFDVVGTPDVVAIRFKNEDMANWSAWIPFDPQVGEYHAEVPWKLSIMTGLKTVDMQVATYQGLATSAVIYLVADYDTIEYSVNFYSDPGRVPESQLVDFQNIPVASIENDIANTQSVYIDVIPNNDYLSTIDPATMAPTFSVFTQGNVDILNRSTVYVENADRGRIFEGSFEINRSTPGLTQDGAALLIPHFVDDPSGADEADVEIDTFNIFSGRAATPASEELERDELGRVKYAITSRAIEDPYFVFGDPNYRLHKKNG